MPLDCQVTEYLAPTADTDAFIREVCERLTMYGCAHELRTDPQTGMVAVYRGPAPDERRIRCTDCRRAWHTSGRVPRRCPWCYAAVIELPPNFTDERSTP